MASGDISGRMKELEKSVKTLSQGSIVELIEALETLLVYVKNLIMYPDERKYRKVKITNIHYQERLGHLKGAKAAMAALGYMPDGEYLRLNDKKGGGSVLLALEKYMTVKLEAVKEAFNQLPRRLTEDHEYKSVVGAGHCSETGKRQSNEDDEIIIDNFCGVSGQGFFGLYDGHGGRATVDFVVKALHMNLACLLKKKSANSWPELWKQTYLATDSQLRRRNILRSGSTSVTCVLRTEGSKRMLHVANVGDSRAILIRGGKGIRLTFDHKASDPEEAKRITDAGGFIGRGNRVNGVLAISRALGDHMLKENDVVTAAPFCNSIEITPQDTHLLLACDGVWDVVTDQEAADFVLKKAAQFGGIRERGTPMNTAMYKTAKALAQEALDRRSLDNITTMVMKL